MAKRARGSHRPGQRQPVRRTNRPASPRPASTTSADVTRPSSSLTLDEEARAAELEARIMEQEREAEAIRARGRARASAATGGEEPIATPRGVGRPASGGLAVRYAHEYDYVARDLRRISIVIAVLMGVLVVLWIAVNQFGLFAI